MNLKVAHRLWPELNTLSPPRQLLASVDILTIVYALPIAIAGLFWLASATDLKLIVQQWQIFLVMGGLLLIFEQITHFLYFEVSTYSQGGVENSFGGIIQWAAVLLLGPTALWLSVSWIVVHFVIDWRKAIATQARWTAARQLVLELATITIAYLTALLAYTQLGGTYPISGLSLAENLPALIAILVYLFMVYVVWSGYLFYALWVQKKISHSSPIHQVALIAIIGLALPALADPFGIFAAALYAQEGLYAFSFFVAGLLLVALLARQMSWAVESSRQQSRLMEKLEQLGRATLGAPPGEGDLGEILDQYIPQFLPASRMAVWLVDISRLVFSPPDFDLNVDPIWEWIIGIKEPHVFQDKQPLPWGSIAARHRPVLITPILDVEARVSIGFIYLELPSRMQGRRGKGLQSLFPFVQALSAQISAALNQSLVYLDRLDYQRQMQELEFAGRIQSSFLPAEIPTPENWEFAVTLLPARETYGDYFDFIPLPDGRLGILIADVTDKGLGAALYMALSRTLIRTFAQDYDEQPELVFFFANERLLVDARANLFVTAFYGILDPQTGILTYSNAGHLQQYILNPSGGVKDVLPPTGMPLGVEENTFWGQGSVRIEAGDVLLLFTDGIPDAQNEDGEFYEETRLIQTSVANVGNSAQELQSAILEDIQKHVGSARQFDDITLVVLARNN